MTSQTETPPQVNPFLIHPATIMDKTQEATDIVSLRLRLEDSNIRKRFRFQAGQFNMLYVFRLLSFRGRNP